MDKTLEKKNGFKTLLDSYGLPRMIITCFVLLLFIMAPIAVSYTHLNPLHRAVPDSCRSKPDKLPQLL